MKGPVVRLIDKERFFVCDYTGACIQMRFSIPEEGGCFCSLPVILRFISDTRPHDLTRIKKSLETHYNQPDIPMQQPLRPLRPLSDTELIDYLDQIPMGVAWLRIEGGEYIDDFEVDQRAQ